MQSAAESALTSLDVLARDFKARWLAPASL